MGSHSTLQNNSACFQEGNRMSILNLSPSSDSEVDLKKRSLSRLRQCNDPVERIRHLCLSNGYSSLKDFIRLLREGSNGNIGASHIAAEASNKYGLKGVEDEIQKIDCTIPEFIEKINPILNSTRRQLICKIFDLLDKNKKGYCTVDDLRANYNYQKDPLFSNGVKTKDEVFANFLKSFNIDAHKDGKVSREDFINFYAAYSAAIENDINFDFIMRRTWNI